MIRLILALPFAGIMVLALFSFMAWMVDDGDRGAASKPPPLSFNMLMVENEPEVQRRQRSIPEQPKPLQAPEQMPVSQVIQQTSSVSPTSIQPVLGITAAVEGVAISVPTFADFGLNQQALPLYRVEPRYPANALKRKLEGYVVLGFTIDPKGKPTDIKIVDANPRRMFEKEAIRALRKWKYQPKVEHGKASPQFDQSVRVEFKLEK